MKLPFDAQEATRSIVRVVRGMEPFSVVSGTAHWGCGFVVADQYVITAAHCLPRGPDHCFDEIVGAKVASWDGNDEATLAVIYYDFLSDVAVLHTETFSGTYLLPEFTNPFDRIVERAGNVRIDFSFPVELPLRFYIRTHKGTWLTGATEVLFHLGPMFHACLDEGKEIPSGTSGSPVFNEKGEVMGFVSHGDEGGDINSVAVTWLAGALQGWLIRKLDQWQKEEDDDEVN